MARLVCWEALMTTLNINGQLQEVDADPNMPLLWVIREKLKLTGNEIWLRYCPVRCLHCSC